MDGKANVGSHSPDHAGRALWCISAGICAQGSASGLELGLEAGTLLEPSWPAYAQMHFEDVL